MENNSDYKSIWRPVLVFYSRVTSWIIFPLILALIFGKYISKSVGSQVLFFLLLVVAFLVTCYGIYKEIKKYKLETELKDAQNLDNSKNDKQ